MMKSFVPPGLQDYVTDADAERDELISGDLSGHGAKVAIVGTFGVDASCLGAEVGVEVIHKEWVSNWLKSKTLTKVEELDTQADRYVYPSSLSYHSTNAIPPFLIELLHPSPFPPRSTPFRPTLFKAEEICLSNGLEQIEVSLEPGVVKNAIVVNS